MALDTEDEALATLRAQIETTIRAKLKAETTTRLEAYKQGAAFHTFQEGLFWTRNNILVLAQGGLLTAVVGMLKKDDCQCVVRSSVGAVVLCTAGFFTAIAWVAMVVRSRLVLNESLDALSCAEEGLSLIDNGAIFTRVNRGYKTMWDDKLASSPNSSTALQIKRSRSPIVSLQHAFTDGKGVRLSTIWEYLGGMLAVLWLALWTINFFNPVAEFVRSRFCN